MKHYFLAITLLVTFISACAQDPEIEALRFKGDDISCVKKYKSTWNVKFGEREYSKPELAEAFYFNRDGYRVGQDGLSDRSLTYDYTFNDDGTLKTVDVYAGASNSLYMKAVVRGNTVYLYDQLGQETNTFEPIHAIPTVNGDGPQAEIYRGIMAKKLESQETRFKVTKDVKGRITHRIENLTELQKRTWGQDEYTYSYDAQNRLVFMSCKHYGSGYRDYKREYQYDDRGNITRLVHIPQDDSSGEVYTYEYAYNEFDTPNHYTHSEFVAGIEAQKEAKEEARLAREREKQQREAESAARRRAERQLAEQRADSIKRAETILRDVGINLHGYLENKKAHSSQVSKGADIDIKTFAIDPDSATITFSLKNTPAVMYTLPLRGKHIYSTSYITNGNLYNFCFGDDLNRILSADVTQENPKYCFVERESGHMILHDLKIKSNSPEGQALKALIKQLPVKSRTR